MRMVEWKKLGEVCELERGVRVIKKDLQEEGLIPVYQNSLTPLGYFDKSNYPANTPFVICAGAAGEIGFCNKPFWAADDCTCILCSSSVNKKFIYYCLLVKQHTLKSQVRKASVPRLSKEVIGKLIVPIPSMSEQERVVGILDTFISSIDNLKQQIAQRRKQYEYYRDQLLDLEGKEGVEMKTLGEVCSVITGGEVPEDTIKGQLTPSTEYPYAVYTNGKETYGFTKNYQVDSDAVCISSIGANTGAIYYKVGKFTPAIRLKVLIPIQKLNTRFLYYAASKIDFRGKNTGSVPNINANYVKSKEIPVPSLSDQQRIVDILDKFEASIQNLEAQLSQREKQYEYYRNKLLTFD